MPLFSIQNPIEKIAGIFPFLHRRRQATTGLFLGLSFMLVLIIVLAVIALLGLNTTHSRLHEISSNNIAKFDQIVDMQSAIHFSMIYLHHLVSDDEADFNRLSNKISIAHERYRLTQTRLEQMQLNDIEQKLLSSQRDDARLFLRLKDEVLDKVKEGNRDEARRIYFDFIVPYFTKTNKTLEQIYKLENQLIEQSSEKADEEYHFTWLWEVLLSVLAILTGVIIALLLIRRLKQHEKDRDKNLNEIQRANRELRFIADDLADARDRAQQSNQAKSAFLANMSHELRTPLNAIMGYSEMLRDEAEEHGLTEFAHDLKKIEFSGRHLLALINEILDLSQIESGKTKLNPERFPGRLLIEEVVSTLRPLAEKKNNILGVDYDENVGDLITDRIKLRQILINLLSNACKFTSNGEISIAIRSNNKKQDRKVIFEISDTGIGMTEEQMSRIFEPFAQADNSTTRRFGGTGLGLTICKRFCEALGGTIIVRSDYGAGSNFTVKIPANLPELPIEDVEFREAHPDLSRRNDVEAPKGIKNRRKKPSTILVIDDDPATRELISRFLCRDGFIVKTAADGKAGIELASEIRPSVIVLDIMMPGMDGWSTIRGIQEDPALKSIPIIVTSMLDKQELGSDLAVHEYIGKPVNRNQLADAVKRCVRKHKSKSILILEDNPEVARRLTDSLTNDGWQTRVENTVEKAYKLLQNNAISLIIIDLATPELEGYEFIEAVRNDPKVQDLPVIGLTLHEQFFNRPEQFDALSIIRINKYELNYASLGSIVYSALEGPTSAINLESASRIA